MYALARNTWKFRKRDKRKIKQQFIETDYLAPDTAEEMLSGISIIKTALEKALNRSLSLSEIVRDHAKIDKEVRLTLDGMINKGKAEIIKPAQGIYLYRMLLILYGGRELIRLSDANGNLKMDSLADKFCEAPRNWMNLGGMIVPEKEVYQLIETVKNNDYSWEKMHRAYAEMEAAYAEAKTQHALFTLFNLFDLSVNSLTVESIKSLLNAFVTVVEQLVRWAYDSRKKDYTGDFRTMNFENKEEMEAVLGRIEENEFLIEYEKEMRAYIKQAKRTAQSLDA